MKERSKRVAKEMGGIDNSSVQARMRRGVERVGIRRNVR